MEPKKRGRPKGSGRGATSLTGKVFEAMAVGDCITFTRDADLSKDQDASNWVHVVGSYAGRRLPGASFTYESFHAITARRRVVVGVIVIRES